MRSWVTGSSVCWRPSGLPTVRFLVLLVLGLMFAVVACGSSESESTPGVDFEEPSAPMGTPVLATAGFLTDREDRSELSRLGTLLPPVTTSPDTTAVMPVLPELTAEAVESTVLAPPVVSLPGHTPAPTVEPLDPARLADALAPRRGSCIAEFRRLVIAYDGPELFGPEVLGRLSDSLLGDRPECGAGGWSPVFDLGAACAAPKVGSMSLAREFKVYSFGRFRGVTGSTLSGTGGALIQFLKMPYSDLPGCWLYSPRARSWHWAEIEKPHPDPISWTITEGDELFTSAVCEGLLQLHLESLSPESGATVVDVLDALAQVRAIEEGECGAIGPYSIPVWDLSVVAEPLADGCPVTSATGFVDEGVSFLVNFGPARPDSEGSYCWTLEVSTEVWTRHGPF